MRSAPSPLPYRLIQACIESAIWLNQLRSASEHVLISVLKCSRCLIIVTQTPAKPAAAEPAAAAEQRGNGSNISISSGLQIVVIFADNREALAASLCQQKQSTWSTGNEE